MERTETARQQDSKTTNENKEHEKSEPVNRPAPPALGEVRPRRPAERGEQNGETVDRRDGVSAKNNNEENIKLPKLVNLIPILKIDTNTVKSELPEKTKLVTTSDKIKKEETLYKPSLRKKVHVDKSHYKPLLKLLTEDTDKFESTNNLTETWLPKYIAERKDTLNKIEAASNNLEQINNQLELVGIINNSNGQGAVILRNKLNNKVEVIKKGEEYLGLELLEIKNNQAILGSKSLNKTYIKNIVVND